MGGSLKPELTRFDNAQQSYGWFFDQTWNVNVHLIWPVDSELVNQYVREQFDFEYGNLKEFSGRCLQIMKGESLAVILIALEKWEPTPRWVACLAHECFHAAEMILEERGLKHGLETSEAYTYLLESLVRRCMTILEQPKQEGIEL